MSGAKSLETLKNGSLKRVSWPWGFIFESFRPSQTSLVKPPLNDPLTLGK